MPNERPANLPDFETLDALPGADAVPGWSGSAYGRRLSLDEAVEELEERARRAAHKAALYAGLDDLPSAPAGGWRTSRFAEAGVCVHKQDIMDEFCRLHRERVPAAA